MRRYISIALYVLLLSSQLAVAEPGEPIQQFTARRIVDLSHPLSADSPVWPGGEPFKLKRLVDYDKGYRLHSFSMQENVGTHLDAPSHFAKGKADIDTLPLSSLVVPAVVIDVQDKVRRNADFQLSPDDIRAWEKEHGTIAAGSLVILSTGWHTRVSSHSSYRNMDKDGVMHFPGYSKAASELLVQRDVAGIGIDTMSLDHGASKDFATHGVMLSANKYMLENLTNLDALPSRGATVVVGVLPVRGGTQAQARIFALLK